jgi:hypothetical protein
MSTPTAEREILGSKSGVFVLQINWWGIETRRIFVGTQPAELIAGLRGACSRMWGICIYVSPTLALQGVPDDVELPAKLSNACSPQTRKDLRHAAL